MCVASINLKWYGWMILYVEGSANYEIKPIKPIVCQKVRPKWNYWKVNVLSTSHLQMEILTYILLLSRLFETLNEETLNKMEWKENNIYTYFLTPSFKSLIWEKDIECHKNLLIMLVLFFFIFFNNHLLFFNVLSY